MTKEQRKEVDIKTYGYDMSARIKKELDRVTQLNALLKARDEQEKAKK